LVGVEEGRRIAAKTVYIIMIAMFISGFMFCHALYTYWIPIYTKQPPKTSIGANVFITIETPMGIREIPIHNVITDIGEQQAAERFRTDGSYTALKYISIGNATASASLTQLTTEYTRAEGTISDLWTYNGDSAFNCTKKFTFTETVTLNAAGWHWASTGNNNMYAVANFDQTTFQANWNLTITWIGVFDGN